MHKRTFIRQQLEEVIQRILISVAIAFVAGVIFGSAFAALYYNLTQGGY